MHRASRDPWTGRIWLFFIADGDPSGLRARSSDDPASFAVDTERPIHPDLSRPGLSFDARSNVWRISFDVGYDPALYLAQSWAETLEVDRPLIEAHATLLHEPTHALHPDIHTAAVGMVLQSANAIYPSADAVVFFYSGIGTSGHMRVNAQRCRRRP